MCLLKVCSRFCTLTIVYFQLYCSFIENRLWLSCISVNLQLFSWMVFLQEHLQGTAFHNWGEAGLVFLELMLFSYGWGMQKVCLSLKSVTHILQWWNLVQLYLTYRRFKKYMDHVTPTLISADISIFSPENRTFCHIKKYWYRLHFDAMVLIIPTFFESLKIV